MASDTPSQWESIKPWSPILLLVGGGLLVGHAAILGFNAFTGLTTPTDVFGPVGHLVALLGLIGLYPALVDRTPMLARITGTVAAVALVGWAVLSIGRFLTVAGILSPPSEALPGAFFMIMFATTILSYILSSAASVRGDRNAGPVGLLLLAPAVLLIVALLASAVVGVGDFLAFVIGSGLALSMLALGDTLRTKSRQTANETLVGDMTVG